MKPLTRKRLNKIYIIFHSSDFEDELRIILLTSEDLLIWE